MAIEAERLEAFPLFAGLRPEHLKRIAEIAEEVIYQRNVFLFHEGDEGDAIYLIEDGAVRISKDIPGVGEEAFAVLKAGSYFGEMNFATGIPRTADARINDKARLVRIDNLLFRDLMAADKDLAIGVLTAIVKTLASRLDAMNERMRALLAMSVPFSGGR